VWLRSTLTIQEIKATERNLTIFSIPDGPSCAFTSSYALECSSGQFIDLTLVNDINQWKHLTYIARWKENTSVARLDLATEHHGSIGVYQSFNSNVFYLGIDSALLGHGFIGRFREFYMGFGAIEETSIIHFMNMMKVFDVSTMGNYNFEQRDGSVLKDVFRD
jgi:hypothetical protein